jgi:Ca2+-binding EF-hand superfamily protein
MERLDANHDGSLTADELSGERRARLLAADTDGDGSVSTEELQSFVQNQMENGAGRGARFQGPGGPEGGPGPGGLLQRLDTNGDGRVELSEIPEQRRERWAAADTNGDGELSSEEIRARAGAGNQRRGGGFGGQPVSPEAMLQRMDENGDGMIQLSEIPERRRERLGAADTDGDGAITLQELTAHMEAMRAQGGPGGPGGPPPEGPGGPPPEGGPGGPPPGDAPPPPPF